MQNLSSMHPASALLTMHPLVHEKLDEFLEQETIVPVTEPTDWVSSLAYSWKANGKLWVCLDPKDLIATICTVTTTIPQPWMRSLVSLAVVHASQSWMAHPTYLCIILNYESSLLTTFNIPVGMLQICPSPPGALPVPRTSFNG